MFSKSLEILCISRVIYENLLLTRYKLYERLNIFLLYNSLMHVWKLNQAFHHVNVSNQYFRITIGTLAVENFQNDHER